MNFSVVIATFNRRGYVLEAVKSVLEQALFAFEVIVVVDGSVDGTADAVRTTYPSVKVLEQSNLGPSVAHNAGIAAASGEWICFLDDDDLWHREKLAVTAEYLSQHPECLACNSPVWWFCESSAGPTGAFGFKRDFVARSLDECHRLVAERDPSANSFDYLQICGDSFNRLRDSNRGALSASVVRRDVIITAGCFSPMQTCGDDWTMFVNVSRLCEWHTIPRRLTFCRLHSGQNTGDAANGLYILVGQLNAWLAGRGCIERNSLKDVVSSLSQEGSSYRVAVQGYLWDAVRRGDLLTANLIRRAGTLLLPRTRDRLYSLIPPQLTWRFEKYVLGMHK